MRHVSMFRLKPEYRTEEILGRLAQALKALPAQIPGVVGCEIGVRPLEMPAESPNGQVRFYDLIQILDFATPEDCAAYPATAGHRAFLAASGPYMEQVAAMDYAP